MKKLIFITWERYNRRPELLAQLFGARNFFISYGQKGNIFQFPVRYFVQTRETWKTLREEKPDVVFVQNPPIFCAFVIYLYSLFHKTRYIIDSHTGAFVDRKWRWSLSLHRMLSSKALLTLVHNKSQAEITRQWGCRYMVLSYPPGEYPMGEKVDLKGEFNIAVIGSINEDEPMDIVFEAARSMPEVTFHITGDSKRIDAKTLDKRPANCILTGYTTYERYIGLLRNVNALMTLTTRDNTLLMGGFEAISLNKPLIVSDFPVLREYFPRGAVFVQNTADGICEGVNKARQNQQTLNHEMEMLQKELVENWKKEYAEVQELIQGIPTAG